MAFLYQTTFLHQKGYSATTTKARNLVNLLPLPPDVTSWWLLHFPDDVWRLVYAAVIWACYILSIHNYHSTGGHLHVYNTWLHHPKVRYHMIYLCNKQNKTTRVTCQNSKWWPNVLVVFLVSKLEFWALVYNQWYNAFNISNKRSSKERFVRFEELVLRKFPDVGPVFVTFLAEKSGNTFKF